jgi:hypothetical protein
LYVFSAFDSSGRPKDVYESAVFEELCSWLEVSDDELLTIQDLVDKAKTIAGNDNVYSESWLKILLKKLYNDHRKPNEAEGRKIVI